MHKSTCSMGLTCTSGSCCTREGLGFRVWVSGFRNLGFRGLGVRGLGARLINYQSRIIIRCMIIRQ